LEKYGGLTTKASVNMHCFVYGKENHNKKSMINTIKIKIMLECRLEMRMGEVDYLEILQVFSIAYVCACFLHCKFNG
jgi:hypothetical protein